MHRSRRHRAWLVTVLALACLLEAPVNLGAGRAATLAQERAAARPEVVVEVTVLDASGRVPPVFVPADFSVTVGGRARTVAWIRRVSRGPGALADAAARRVSRTPTMSVVAEPSRVVIFVIDEPSLPMGGERPAIVGAAALLDRLGMNDHVAVVRLPAGVNAAPAPSLDRPLHREAIARIAGRLLPEQMPVDGVTPDSSHIAGNPMGARINREERADRPEPTGGTEDTPGQGGGLDGLIRVLRASAGLPGRKVVAFYSSGLDERTAGRLPIAARLAAEAGATVMVFGLPAPKDPRYSSLDARLLPQLAAATGGAFVRLGRNPARDIEPLTPELDARVQLGLVPEAGDIDGTPKAVRVDATRAGLVVRAPAFVALNVPPAGDVEPPPPVPPAAPAAAPADAYRGAGLLTDSTPSPAKPGLDPEATRILARLIDYTEAYIGQYSALVAEEEYRQSQPAERQNRRLRSDLLFVRPESAKEWVSFRDVYEVDGRPVRDRDRRLQDLFLRPRPGGRAQLQAIKEESARYNIGSFDRTINVPLFPLKILNREYRDGFTFLAGRASETAGVRTWRLTFSETARPTLVHDRVGRDVPLHGAFVIEQATGAIVETAVSVARSDYSVSIVVRYARHEKLGMWLPAEMKEAYKVALPLALDAVVLEGTARYSNFRRFQVSTDVEIAPQK